MGEVRRITGGRGSRPAFDAVGGPGFPRPRRRAGDRRRGHRLMEANRHTGRIVIRV
ncbi:hypothetical protein [Streptomyces sp. PKU-EA00015]|uniref:hypothetical protein n=1 Tax=Streptomyces sp. PKU-EA00015 TaxID=2748326 RepID=UPI001C431F81|nr:hypothetical protein [Streptomyces sp. PKU-EA00015]